MSNLAIQLVNVSKKYILHHEKPTLMENIFKRQKTNEFWALKNITLEIKKGEKVGIIGDNGSGKTTLLKIMAQITQQTTGQVVTMGKVVSLIDLEAGFHPELTGEENIYLNAMLLGMNRQETKKRFKKIAEFADIGQFLDAPLYTYSSGMKLRLGFSIAAYADPDILLLDENLSVGDQDFQKKSMKKIQEFFKKGKTIILVSHWLEFIRENCRRVILMEKGRVKKDNIADKITKIQI